MAARINDLEYAAACLRAARRITVLTGAGVSSESGVPTFRDALDGLWSRYDPALLATPDAFAERPALVWAFYQFRRRIMRPAQPNPGHYALAALERRSAHFTLITQNVDDLHERAGSQNVIRLHGRITANRCSANCQGNPTPIEVSVPPETEEDLNALPPACPYCGAFVRPDVVWFGEMLPEAELWSAIEAVLACDVMLIVGTSGMVSPASELPGMAQRKGAVLIEVNPHTSALTPMTDVWLSQASASALPALLDRL